MQRSGLQRALFQAADFLWVFGDLQQAAVQGALSGCQGRRVHQAQLTLQRAHEDAEAAMPHPQMADSGPKSPALPMPPPMHSSILAASQARGSN